MDLAIRPAGLADLDAILHTDGASFGIGYEPDDRAMLVRLIDWTRFRLAVDDGQVVGVAGEFPFTMTVPGGATVEVAGVTWVSVSPTHRRRGVLRALMSHQLDEVAADGRPAAILTASESSIYGRFGYGAASQQRRVVIDRRAARLARPGDYGPVRLAAADEARAAMPGIHERWRATVPGALSRSDARWDAVRDDPPSRRGGKTGLYYLLHSDGYVGYRAGFAMDDWQFDNTCSVVEYAAATPQAHAALWQVLLGLDLYGTIESHELPVDDPLPDLLTDARVVRTAALVDGVWVRPLDLPALLAARRYGVEIDVVLEVDDDRCGGRYRLQGGPDGASCRPTSSAAEVTLPGSAVGSLFLGGRRAQQLARAGVLQADDPAVLRRVDRAMLGDRAPFHGTPF